MHDTLKLISIQHELGMAIGLDIHLKPMLKEFIQVALKRLGLSGVDFYFHSKIVEKPTSLNRSGRKLSHILSVPELDTYKALKPTINLNKIFEKLQNADEWHEIYNKTTQSYVYFFKLADIGLIILYRKYSALNTSYLAMLFPIFKRLAISCQTSLEHEQLLQAIEARKVAESTITYQLLHDELTRLPNRRMLMDFLHKDFKRSAKRNVRGALLFIDLDRFKSINDTLGHDIGDQLLKAVADILLKSVRKKDLVARLSGDEFVIVLKDIQVNQEHARKIVDLVVQKIFNVFTKPIKAGEHLLQISPSIGIEFYPWENVTPDKVLRNADTAMYLAKTQSQFTAVFYESQMSADLEQRLDIEKQLQLAVKTGDGFSVEYQPQFNSKGECIGAEALTRWRKPNGFLVSPSLFIPVAEETGLILELGKWVIKTACKDIRNFEKIGLPASFKHVSVNVSAVQLNQDQFLPDLFTEIQKAKILPKHLCIELTESALINNVTMTREKIVQLKSYGIEVSVDDFGTGYSSLSYLNKFPISALKIDQAFVRNMDKDGGNRAIVGTIVALAESLSLSVIAEGVETLDELISLQELGCHSYQGFYFSKSICFDKLIELIADNVVSKNLNFNVVLNRRHTDNG